VEEMVVAESAAKVAQMSEMAEVTMRADDERRC
jgi:hypothetical protein